MKPKIWLSLLGVLVLAGVAVGLWMWFGDKTDGTRSAAPSSEKGPAGASGSGHPGHDGAEGGEPGTQAGQDTAPDSRIGEGEQAPGSGLKPGQPPAPPETSAEAPQVPGRKYDAGTEGDPNSYLLEASDQQSDGRSVVIRKVIIRGSGGYIALHSQQGEPWPLFAASGYLPEGEHNNVVIRWRRSIAFNMTVFPMLHIEDNRNTTFDFPDHDEAPKINGAYIVFPVKLYVE